MIVVEVGLANNHKGVNVCSPLSIGSRISRFPDFPISRKLYVKIGIYECNE